MVNFELANVVAKTYSTMTLSVYKQYILIWPDGPFKTMYNPIQWLYLHIKPYYKSEAFLIAQIWHQKDMYVFIMFP